MWQNTPHLTYFNKITLKESCFFFLWKNGFLVNLETKLK